MTAQAFHGFEGSYLGDATRLNAGSVMECKICWSLYDPAQGCETWQVPPGTPFAALPDTWRCPTCDAPKEQFMVVHELSPQAHAIPDSTGTANTTPAAPQPRQSATPADNTAQHPSEQAVPPATLFARQLEATFRDIHANQMRGVPIVNAALNVKAVGFQERDGHILGVLITPWFMNLVQAPLPDTGGPTRASGEKVLLGFPSGDYEFTAVNRDQAGDLPPYLACSLFSPMFYFTTMLQAIETAQAALASLMDPTLHPAYRPAPASNTPVAARSGRRALLTGNQNAQDNTHI